jgi:hypothetical protein
MLRKHLTGLLIAGLIVSGCASVRGGPPSIIDRDAELAVLKNFYGAKEIINYAALGPNERPGARDLIVTSQLYAIDLLYDAYEERLFVEARSINFLTSFTSIALTGVAALLQVSQVQAILAGIDTGLKGTKESFDNEILLDRTLQVLIQQMRGERAKVRERIFAGLGKRDGGYPLPAALSDLRAYERAGTLAAALTSLSVDVGASAALAEEKASAAARTFSFRFSTVYTLLKKCVDPPTSEENKKLINEMTAWLTPRHPLNAGKAEADQETIPALLIFGDPNFENLQLEMFQEFCT